MLAGRRIRTETGEDEQATIAGVVLDAAVVRGDGADLRETTRVVGRQFVERPRSIEHVALRADLAADAFVAERAGALEGRFALRQAPAALVVHVEHGGGVQAQHVLRNGDVLLHPRDAGRVIGLAQLQLAVEVVAAEFAGGIAGDEAQVLELRATRVEQAAVGSGFTGLGEAREHRSRHDGPLVRAAVVEERGGLRAVAAGRHPHPDALCLRGELGPGVAAGGDFHVVQLGPLAVALGVHFEGEGYWLRGIVREVQRAMRIAGEHISIARYVGFHRLVKPHRAAPDGRAKLVEPRRLGEPQVRLRSAGADDFALGLAFVEELALRRVIAAEDELIIPAAEVADDLQVVRARREAGGISGAEGLGELPERAVHGHEELAAADLADARPLGVPAVRAVVAVRAFRQAEAVPLPGVEHLQNE